MFANSRQSGFTLLEVLAAFVVFSIAFVAVMQILSGSVRTTTRAQEFTQATLWAQSILDMVGLDIPVEPGSFGGNFDDDYGYELNIDLYEFADETGLEIRDAVPIELYRVELVVDWGDPSRPRQARFVTLKAITAER